MNLGMSTAGLLQRPRNGGRRRLPRRPRTGTPARKRFVAGAAAGLTSPTPRPPGVRRRPFGGAAHCCCGARSASAAADRLARRSCFSRARARDRPRQPTGGPRGAAVPLDVPQAEAPLSGPLLRKVQRALRFAHSESLARRPSARGSLVVSPKEVVHAGDGCLSPECLVSAAMVVFPKPAVKRAGAFG